MQKISACVITYNDEHTVAWSVGSVQWADEVVVVDTGSTDRTIEIAERLGARVVRTAPFAGFGEMRNRALEHCTHDWVFSVDADEHCTRPLQDEIMALMAGEPAHDAYYVPRRNYLMGRWIRGSGWYRDHRTPQLFRKSRLRYTPSLSHENHELNSAAPPGSTENVLWHFPFSTLEEVLHKANLYSSLGAQAQENPRASMWSALGHGLWAFARLYIFKRGFVDGWAGFIIALSNFEGTFYRYAKAHEKAQGWGAPPEEPAREPPSLRPVATSIPTE
ncbi:MAG: glycosyltransferase family 2 protein [Xanthobacteraceae bacterium]|jgi:glycosyltransferase involved in cell wall biosynthesis